MRSEAGVTTGRWMRLVLLLCTLVGLAAMHTLGHGAHASGTHASAMQASGTHASGTHASGMHASGARPAARLAGTAGDLAVDGLSGHVVDLAAGAVAVVPAVASVSGRTLDCAGDGCGAALAAPLAPSGGDPGGWSVCLAVLGGFALVLLVVVLLRRRVVGLPSAPGSPGASGPRAPPSPPVGLRLAAASVLRR